MFSAEGTIFSIVNDKCDTRPKFYTIVVIHNVEEACVAPETNQKNSSKSLNLQ